MPTPAPDRDPPLSIRLFGALEVRLSGQPLPRLRSRKGEWLLALLVLRDGQPVLRDWLAETLWPDSSPEAALTSLRQSLKDLRSALGDQAWRLQKAGGRRLALELSHARVDLHEFRTLLEVGDAESLARAVALYRGPLLEGCREPWLQADREQYERAYLGALERLSREAEARGDLALAAGYLRRAAATVPGSEPVHRSLMAVLSRSGETQAAIEVYQRLRRWLHRECAAEPDAETTALYQRIRAGARRTDHQRTPPEPSRAAAAGVPLPLTPLIGRERELAEIEGRLLAARLVTLTGTGGVGKTRLALAVAVEAAPQFADGACFVDFSAVGSDALLRSTLAAALGLGTGPDPESRLIPSLAPRQLLLVLDNCEHLLAGCARLVHSLVSQCPAVRILATSREPLGLTGEVRIPIPPLPLPDTAHGGRTLQEITASPAVRLFCERASAVAPGFAPGEADAPLLLQLCRCLDGLPLALELAASMLDVLSLPEILRGLDDRFRFLAGADPTRPERQQTLQGVVDWSYERLDPEEQRLFRWVGAFTGSWNLAALDSVCSEPAPVLPVLTRLVRKSLVVPEDLPAGGRRYRMLETLRQYARQRLAEAGEADAVRKRHLEWARELVALAAPQLSGPDQTAALERLTAEEENLNGALEWALEPERDPEICLSGAQLAAELGRYWQIRGLYRQGGRHLHRSLARLPTAAEGETRLRATLLGWAGFLMLYEGRYQEATEQATAALRIWEALGDVRGRAEALGTLAICAKDQGDTQEARPLFAESLRLSEQVGDTRGIASSLGYLGILAADAGEPDEAEPLFARALALRRSLRDTWGIAASLNNLGRLAAARGDLERARSLLEESLELRRQLGDRRSIAVTLNSLGSLLLCQDRLAPAAACFMESLELVSEIGDRRSIAYSLEAAAQVAHKLEENGDALRLLGAAAALRRELPAPLSSAGVTELQKLLASLRERTGDPNSLSLLAAGEALTPAQRVQLARTLLQRAASPAS